MELAPKIVRLWFAFWIAVLYGLRLRRPLNNLQRRLKRERREARLELADIRTVDELRAHVKPFQYREDKGRIGGLVFPLDYVSSPEVFEARLKSSTVLDGDCDDLHHYLATQLERMGLEAWHVTIGYQGGGHVACVFRKGDELTLWNYHTLTKLESFDDAGVELLRWATRGRKKNGREGPARMRWLVFETTELRRVKL